jgi:hypothetical protein
MRWFGIGGEVRRCLAHGTIGGFLIVAALWFWCRDGSVTVVRIVAEGQHFRAFIDGRLIVEAERPDASSAGGVGFFQGPQYYWGLPVPQMVTSVRVTDSASGRVLLDQDFTQPLQPVWQNPPAGCAPRPLGYRCDPHRPVGLFTGFRDWGDYTAEFRVRNYIDLELFFRYRSPDTYASFFARPVLDLDSGFTFCSHGRRESIGGQRPYYGTVEIVRNIILLFLRPFPVVVLAILLLGICLLLAGFIHWPLAGRPRLLEPAFLAAVFVGACAYLGWINYSLLDHMPHVQDSVVYNFEAALLSKGKLFAPAPPNPPSFDFNFLVVRDGKWFGQYPLGYPLLLAAGHVIGAPWVIPPLVGACVLVLTYLIARELFSRKVAAVSCLLAFFSPFFQVNAPNFMSHSTASLYLALGILLLIRSCSGGEVRRQTPCGFLAGLSLGLLFNTRPLNALPVLAIAAAVLLWCACIGRTRFTAVALFLLGVAMNVALLLLMNYATMGHPFRAAYAVCGSAVSFFGPDYPLGVALLHYYTSMTLFVMVIFGWPPFFTLAFFLCFFCIARKNAWSVVLCLIFFTMTLANLFFSTMSSPGHMYGPRYVYEPFFIFIILAVYGWDEARRFVGEMAGRGGAPARAASLICHGVFWGLLVVLTISAQLVWLSRGGALFQFPFMPGNLFALKGFNYTSGAMIDKVKAEGIHHALLFVEDREPDWWYYGALFPLNSPFLDSDIVVARDRGPGENARVMGVFPDRAVYRVNVKRQEIRPYR